jgi:photosystem II stability/assembly factor-like uncharacterized protein
MTLHVEETRAPLFGGDMPAKEVLTQKGAVTAEALFREARQRRRRRWIVAVALVLAVAAIIAVVAGRGGPRATPPANLHTGGKLGTATTGSRSKSGSAAASLHYTPIQDLGLADLGVSWAVNGDGVYLSTNAGRTWRTITPAPVKLGDPTEDVDSLVGIGTKDLWMPVNDVFGVIPPNDDVGAFRRAGGIEYSTDGGQTWTFNTLVPGCLVSCGADSVSFIDAKHGFAAGETSINGPSTMLYSTLDGGVTWHPVAIVPGGGAHDITFTTSDDGWAVTGPTDGTSSQNQGQVTDPGGTLYRTTDGGTTWSLAPGLPVTSRYELPTFFGQHQGLVLGQARGHKSKILAVYTTDDGGATWSVHPLPDDRAVATYATNNPVENSQFAFSAISLSQWKLFIGPYLYVTNDAGRTWMHSVPTPKLESGAVDLITFSSTSEGLAIAMPSGCAPYPNGGDSARCSPSLMRTTDGGKRWMASAP